MNAYTTFLCHTISEICHSNSKTPHQICKTTSIFTQFSRTKHFSQNITHIVLVLRHNHFEHLHAFLRHRPSKCNIYCTYQFQRRTLVVMLISCCDNTQIGHWVRSYSLFLVYASCKVNYCCCCIPYIAYHLQFCA